MTPPNSRHSAHVVSLICMCPVFVCVCLGVCVLWLSSKRREGGNVNKGSFAVRN